MFPFKVKCDNQFSKQHLSAAQTLVVTQDRRDVSHESHWSDNMRTKIFSVSPLKFVCKLSR